MKKLVTIFAATFWNLFLIGQQIQPPQELEIDFAKKYHFWGKIKDGTWEVATCESDSLPSGARYYLTTWSQTLIPGFRDLNFWLVKKVGNRIIYDNKLSTTGCGISDLEDKVEEYFLLGINQEGKVLYLSGDIILNEIRWYLVDSENYDAIAAARLAFLLPENIRMVKQDIYWVTFSANSRAIGRKFYIQISKYNRDHFQIWEKGNPQCPIQDTRK